MKYRPTILNIGGGIMLIFAILMNNLMYDELARDGGFGLLLPIFMGVFFIVAMIIDFLLQLFIKNRDTLNIIEIVLFVILMIIPASLFII